MTIQQRLLARKRAEGVDLPDGTVLKRVHASLSNRRNGAWSWCAMSSNGADLHVGSQYSMAQCLHAPKLLISKVWNCDDTFIDIGD